MGLILKTSEVQSEIQQIRSWLDTMKESYSGVLQEIQGFSENEALQSEAWNTTKTNVKETHHCIVQGIWTARNLMGNDLDSLETSIDGVEDLDEDELQKEIDDLTIECKMYESLMQICQSMQIIASALGSSRESSMADQVQKYQELLEQTEKELRQVEEKLQLLRDIESITSGLFKEISNLVHAIGLAIGDANFYITGQGSLSEENWRIEISKALQNIEKEFYLEYYLECELGISAEGFREMYGEKLVKEVQDTLFAYSIHNMDDIQKKEVNTFILERTCDCFGVKVQGEKYQLCADGEKVMCEFTSQEIGHVVMNIAYANRDVKIKHIANYLQEKLGLTDVQTAAVMGNMDAESSFSPLIRQSDSTWDLYWPEYIQEYAEGDTTVCGWGLIQWTYSTRKKGLLEYAMDKGKGDVSYFGDMDTQLEYLSQELDELFTDEFEAFKKYKKEDELDAATKFFCEEILSPSTEKAHIEERQKEAAEILEIITENGEKSNQ